MASKRFSAKYFYVRGPGVANFADIIETVTVFIKSQDSKKVTKTGNYVPECKLHLYFLI